MAKGIILSADKSARAILDGGMRSLPTLACVNLNLKQKKNSSSQPLLGKKKKARFN